MIKRAKQTFVLQQDISDCGIACLLSITRYLDGDNSLEHLRQLSGTSATGTTLLGLHQCADQIGLVTEAFEAEIENLKELKDTAILHLTLEDDLEHYVVFYNFSNDNNHFLIGDPAKGVELWTEDKLLRYWKSNILLTVKPADNFVKSKQQILLKRNWFLSLVTDDINLLLIASFIGVIVSTLGLSTAIYIQKLIDEIIPKHETNRLFTGLIILLMLLIARAGISYLRQHFLLLQAKDFNERITGSFVEKLLQLPKLFFDSRKTGDLIARLNDTIRIQHSVAYLSGTFIIDFLVVIVSSIYLFLFHYSIALVTLLSLPIMGIIAWKYNDIIIENNGAVMSAYAANESNYIDTIGGISIIKASNKEALFTEKMRAHFGAFQSKTFVLGRTSNRFNLIVEITASVLIVGIIGMVSYFTIRKQFKIGEMMAVLSIVIGLLPSSIRLMLTNLQIQEAKVAFNRMYELTAANIEVHTSFTEPIDWDYNFEELEVKDLSFRFAGRSRLIKNGNLLIEKGKITILFGESGSGKSTIMQLLQRFYEQESGNITINKKFPLAEIPIKDWRNLVAVLPQEVKIFNITIVENICLSKDNVDFNDVIALCQNLGLLEYFNQFPNGLFTKIGEDGLNISGGQKQIVGLLRALFRKPQLLLLDEATSSLDPKTELFILDLLVQLKSKMGILLISHKEATASIADFQYKIVAGDIDTVKNFATTIS
ncbi:peptidase domain-containing ABC transporter [Pedobacter cryoconitis]|uniref:ATP-binding cassette subfamily B protein n=1 Tax=Pedobacter cryoconitis TaxID=188932 RepID=A0A7X0J0T6_9SPHI|nr:peptidase domain-containing ABC transporter [Pedobacter cryoconitis]MBB6498981.1 ATP-binding cassette subfamily B protein [Pedobacter cryoconitis]